MNTDAKTLIEVDGFINLSLNNYYMHQLKIANINYKKGKLCYYNKFYYTELWLDGSYKTICIDRHSMEKITIDNWVDLTEEEKEKLFKFFRIDPCKVRGKK